MDKNILKREHNLFATICIVVGFVVGTGIFWRPGRVLDDVAGDVGLGLWAWLLGGLLILTCVYMFSVFATRYEKVHGMVDYAEVILGKKFGYLAGWFFFMMYQTAGYAIIAWISASFTATLAGHQNVLNSTFVFSLAAFYMLATFLINYFFEKLPIKLNNLTTILRLIPLVLMGVGGLFWAFFNNPTSTEPITQEISGSPSFLAAVFSTVFAYNGWQAAVVFNSEVKNTKKKFPIALMGGFLLVVVIYILYFYGLVAIGDASLLIANNQLGTRAAFASLFGDFASSAIMIFVIISGLGILNMCCRGMSRSLYALARRNLGPAPKKLVQLKNGIPKNSMLVCLLVSFLWFLVIYGNHSGWFGTFRFDLPDFYNMVFFFLLIPMFIGFFKKNFQSKKIHWFNRLVAPFLAAFSAGFMIFALLIASPINALVYGVVFIALAAIGFIFIGEKNEQKT